MGEEGIVGAAMFCILKDSPSCKEHQAINNIRLSIAVGAERTQFCIVHARASFLMAQSVAFTSYMPRVATTIFSEGKLQSDLWDLMHGMPERLDILVIVKPDSDLEATFTLLFLIIYPSRSRLISGCCANSSLLTI